MRHRRYSYFILYALFFSIALCCCTEERVVAVGGGNGYGGSGDPTGYPVLFTSGNLTPATTRSAGIPYMAQHGRFVCSMYYHPGTNDTDSSAFELNDVAWLRVNDDLGNSVYWNKEYDDRSDSQLDDYGFDKTATIFYWQNRLTHAFLALADYHQLTINDGATTAQGKLKMYPAGDDYASDDDTTEVKNLKSLNTYDLTRGSRDAIAEQPDPILAFTVMKPAGATQESNRVRLYFKHQFSQIQVNLRGADDHSANISAEQIDSVELLGVSTEGYVRNRLNANDSIDAAWGKPVDLEEYSDSLLNINKWGTAFSMFDMAKGIDEDGVAGDDGYAIGFLKSFNAIAFGRLEALRITWHEGTKADPGIVHQSTFVIPQTNDAGEQLQELASGKRYVYDLELRRGTLAVIRTQILDWMQKEPLVYGTDGTITN